MNKLQKRILELYRSPYFPFFIFFILVLVGHFFVSLNDSDDRKFKIILEHNDLFSWLHQRYMSWSSRTLIEAVMVTIFSIGGKFWRILDVLIMAALPIALARLFVRRQSWILSVLIIALLLLIPGAAMHSAGWGTTTMNYLWPAASALVSLFPVKKIFNGQKITAYDYVFCSLALIYAVSQEQLCVMMLVIYGSLLAVFLIKRRFFPLLLSQFLITVAGFLYIYSAPGNHARLLVQVEKYNHDYFMIRSVSKIEIGAFSSTLNHFIFQFDPIFLSLCFLLAVGVCARYKDTFLRTISVVPLFTVLMLSVFSPMTAGIFPNAARYLLRTDVIPYGYVRLDNVWSPGSYLPMAALSLVCLCVLLSLFYIIESRSTLFIIYLALFSGFMSRMVIGFTPSAWGSGVRAFFFLYIALIAVIILVYQEIRPMKSAAFNQWLLIIMTLFSGMAALNSYIH